MTEIEKQNSSAVVAFVKDEFAKSIVRWAFLVLASFLAWIFTPAGVKVAAIWNSPEQVAQLQETLDDIRVNVHLLTREVEIARAPREIVEYGPGSRFRDICVAGGTCLLTLEIRRTSASAEVCKIIPEATRRQITSADSGRVWEPTAVSGNVRNIGTDFVINEVTIEMPDGLSPGTYYYRQTTAYTACPWQNDGKPPVLSTSPLIPFEVSVL